MTARRLQQRPGSPPVLVTGGSGFIGCHLADALASRGQGVLILDNLRRFGAQEHAQWLKRRHGDRIEIETTDIRNAEPVRDAVRRASAVLPASRSVAVNGTATAFATIINAGANTASSCGIAPAR